MAIAMYGSGAGAQQAAAPSAPAGGPAGADQGLQEVVVTAQFRQQSLERAPVAISVEDASMIEARSQTDVTSIGMQAPNVTISPGGQGFGNSASFFIRGIGQQDSNPAMEPGVGVYIDDVYFPTVFGSLFNLLDLDRIEILRGPQGTTEGENSLGGAVKLYSLKPNANTGAEVEATTGSYRRLGLRGVADIALIQDSLFLRLSGLSDRRDGYQTRYDYACTHPGSGLISYTNNLDCKLGTLGGTDEKALRAQLRWLPNDAVEVNVSAFGSRDSNEAPAQSLLYAGPTAPSSVINGSSVQLSSRFVPDSIFASYATFMDPQSGKSFPPVSTTDMDVFAATVDWRIADGLTLKSITAYQEYSGQFGFDSGDSPVVISDQENYQSNHTFTQELRLNGSLGRLIDYTVGGFYLDSRTRLEGEIDLPAVLLDFMQHDEIPLKSEAGYLSLTWHATDKLSLSGGLRRTHDDKSYTFGRRNTDGSAISGIPGTPNFLVGGLDGTLARAVYSHWDYRLEADYQWTPGLMTYASWSTGFKGGGVNPRPFVAAEELPFGPETMRAYEIGLKSEFFQQKVRANLALFRNDYESIQEGTSICPPPIPAVVPCDVIINGGKGVIEGAEAEVVARPVAALQIDASASYLDFHYTSIPPGTGLTLEDTLPYSPKFRGSLGIQYAIPLGAHGSLIPRVDASYQSSLYTTSENLLTSLLSEYTLVNGRLTWNANAPWQVALFVTNLADRRYVNNLFPASSDYIEGSPARPREWGLSIRRTF
jgi:iron complex outermembrane recepter protein